MNYNYDKDFITPSATALHLAGVHRARLREYVTFAAKTIHHCRVWLDVGCNSGHFLNDLSIPTQKRIGADLSIGALNHARKCFPQYHWLCMSATTFALANQSCQVVSLLEILGIFSASQQRQIIGEVVRILEPGGWLLVAIRTGQQSHLLTESELCRLLETDFSLLDQFRYDFYYYRGLFKWLQPWRDRLAYYAQIVSMFAHAPQQPSSTVKWRILSFLSHNAPVMLGAGLKVIGLGQKIVDWPLTCGWLGSVLWRLGLWRSKRHPLMAGGMISLWQKKAG